MCQNGEWRVIQGECSGQDYYDPNNGRQFPVVMAGAPTAGGAAPVSSGAQPVLVTAAPAAPVAVGQPQPGIIKP